ncbi:MAG: hypothetical protein ACYDHY_17455 [Acidiferrobacterales bacterium]
MTALRDVTPQRVQPREIARLELAEPFAGWWVDIDADTELGALEDLASQDFRRIVAGLSTMIVDWNFVGKDGKPLPCDATGLRRVGRALLAALLAAFAAFVTLPNS